MTGRGEKTRGSGGGRSTLALTSSKQREGENTVKKSIAAALLAALTLAAVPPVFAQLTAPEKEGAEKARREEAAKAKQAAESKAEMLRKEQHTKPDVKELDKEKAAGAPEAWIKK
jgi:uncharacterized protein HemX